MGRHRGTGASVSVLLGEPGPISRYERDERELQLPDVASDGSLFISQLSLRTHSFSHHPPEHHRHRRVHAPQPPRRGRVGFRVHWVSMEVPLLKRNGKLRFELVERGREIRDGLFHGGGFGPQRGIVGEEALVGEAGG